MKSSAHVLTLVDVSAGYGDLVVLSDVSLSVSSNDFIGVIGPNGGGKTTLLKVIIGLIPPMKGEIIPGKRADGRVIRIGYLPQFYSVDRQFPISVLEVALSGMMGQKGLFFRKIREKRTKAMDTLALLGMETLAGKPVGELSGGQMQRLLLARAIVSDPDLLILDEPGTFVDYSFEGELYESLKELNRNMAIIMVSHDIGMITSYVKTIACVNGKLHHHLSNLISEDQLASYGCPIQMITHGEVPHTVLKTHS